MKVNYKAKLAVAALIAGLWGHTWGVNAAALGPMDLVAADQVMVSAQTNEEHGTESAKEASSDSASRPAYMGILEESKKSEALHNGVRPELVRKEIVTADNKLIKLPKNMTVFDFKRIVTPSGIVDGSRFMPGASQNEAFQNQIRYLAKSKDANLPEYLQFEGQVYRDWNAYQLQGVTKDAHHTAYVVEFALGPDFIRGQRAELALQESIYRNALAKNKDPQYANTSTEAMAESAAVGSVGTSTNYISVLGELSSIGIPWEVRQQMLRNQTNREAREAALMTLMEANFKQRTDLLAPYPNTYTAEGFYKATVESLGQAEYISDAAASNGLISMYKNTLSSAISLELSNIIANMEAKPSLTAKEQSQLVKLKKFSVAFTKFFNTSHIYFDEIKNEEVKSEMFGPMIRSISRGGLYFDSYEIPFNIESLVRFDEKGPVVTTIFANDGDAKYWEKQVQDIWQIQDKGQRIEAASTAKSGDSSNDVSNTMEPSIGEYSKLVNEQMAALKSTSVKLPGINPTEMTVKKLSFTVIVPYLLEAYEKDMEEAVKKGPELRHWYTNELLTGQALEQSQKDYANVVKRSQQIKDYRLGEKTEVYQWQIEDKEGRKTATVLALALTPETTKKLAGMWQESVLDSQLPVLNEQWLQSEGRLNKKITEWASLVRANEHVYHDVKLEKQTPLRKLTQSKAPVYTASTKVYVNINGFELPYYLQGAIVLSKDMPVAYVMFTSDKEGHTFAEKFEDFVKAIK